MYFNDIFPKALSYWQPIIDLSDGLIDEDGNFFSANLSMAWFDATDKFESEGSDNSWVDLMLWSMNRTLTRHAHEQWKSGAYKLDLTTLNTSPFVSDYKLVVEESKNKTIISSYKGVK